MGPVDFVKLEATRANLGVMAGISSVAALKFLQTTFTDAGLGKNTSVMPYLWHTTSPGEEAIRNVGRELTEVGISNGYWVLGCPGGDRQGVYMAQLASSAYALMGNLAMRCTHVWDDFPWLLGRLVHPDVPAAERDRIVEVFSELNECCVGPADGFSIPFKSQLPQADQITQEENLMFLRDTFAMCSSNNLLTEFRFARARRHQHSAAASGCQAVSTAASNHLLGEFQAQHRLVRQEWWSRHRTLQRWGRYSESEFSQAA